ncbi:von Willebrand factor type A domain protein [Thalassoglobus neptunius]|uniref:von Willebrand factor type A domain protein n=1 Tax=Thalassoglobus neptunius TaxID=1938619 RepID=A0A5C5WBF7_9PLAN|nr:VWA domain-containing protein [Thalassoglobus neptunius]TWT46962.1 von Willebrand factor type A domain protein [Thalassoglobus neptunius]
MFNTTHVALGWGMLVVLATGSRLLAEQVELDVASAYGVLKSETKQTTWLRVGLTGFEMESDKERAPVNVAIVLDKSGSMNGEKIERAKAAAQDAIDRLGRNDIVSVITYDTTVNVLVPATKLTDKESIKRAISKIRSNGGTALFAGVSKGAAEVRKFLSEERVNRIILLSDGLANEGPSSPSELGSLGGSLKKEGISVSTLGLGLDYNEDLMAKLASRSGGNHFFIERATELADVFNQEFQDVTSVVAQNVRLKVTMPEGIRPVRVLGNESEISGQTIFVDLVQIYSHQDKHIVIEVEVPQAESGTRQRLAKVSATYLNMQSHETDKLSGAVAVEFSGDVEKVDASINRKVMEDVVAFVSNEQNKLATDFLDAGDLVRCAETLEQNNLYLKANADLFGSERLIELQNINGFQLRAVQQRDLVRARKDMRYLQNSIDLNSIDVNSQLQVPVDSAPAQPVPVKK